MGLVRLIVVAAITAAAAAGCASSPSHKTQSVTPPTSASLEAAIEKLDDAVKSQGQGGTAWDWLFLAMAHHRLCHADEARKYLAKAGKWIDQAEKKRETSETAVWFPWDQRLELRLLRGEAEELLKESKSGAKN